ncbi:isoprenylcysteine carboxyl methyltransferase [Virgibacillus sp. SK37]|nr:isoprenylcysteine carboxyl methyltransferase [Virgibacillus sp. SK37]
MAGIFIFFTIVIWLRMVELRVSKRNERWLRERGGEEKDNFRNKAFFFLYHLSIFSIILELLLIKKSEFLFSFLPVILFCCLVVLKLWCYMSMGMFWNTKNIQLPHVIVIKKGPYKLVRQPYLFLLTAELFLLPFLFKAYMTAFLFLLAHLLILKVDIPATVKSKLWKKNPI